jgi:hypothetical protein
MQEESDMRLTATYLRESDPAHSIFTSRLIDNMCSLSRFVRDTTSGRALATILSSLVIAYPIQDTIFFSRYATHPVDVLYGFSLHCVYSVPALTFLISSSIMDHRMDCLRDMELEKTNDVKIKRFALFSTFLATSVLIALTWSSLDFWMHSQKSEVIVVLALVTQLPCIWVVCAGGAVWVISLFSASMLCCGALHEAKSQLSPGHISDAHMAFAKVAAHWIPGISQGWGWSLTVTVLSFLQFAIVNVMFIFSQHKNMQLDSAGTMSLLASFVVVFVILVLLAIPTTVSTACEACLVSINTFGLCNPVHNEECKILERRLTGGYSTLPTNQFGFLLFGNRITMKLLWSTGLSLASVGGAVVPFLMHE